jgi:hypothetical protein
MKINTLLSSIALTALISSCDLNKAKDETPATTAPATNTAQPAATQEQSVPAATQQQTVPATNPTTTATPPPVTVAPVQTSQPSTGTVALNPAHGQPGHDCSIAVGQPLKNGGGVSNGAVQVSTTPTNIQPQQQQQPITVSAPSTQPLSGNKKLNPAHGQPGHRCDIAVGAPLN